MRVLLLRGDSIRHEALSNLIESSGMLAGEIVERKIRQETNNAPKLIRQHFLARDQSEVDFFKVGKNITLNSLKLHLEAQELSSPQVSEFIDSVRFDIAITFGVSILKQHLIKTLKNQILGVHLGLSPYYRGSGTNFFPFVESELAAVGYTLMHLDETIDGGPIIHQGRAPIVLGDSIHSIGNRNIKQMFDDIIHLLNSRIDFSGEKISKETSGKLFRRSDFTEAKLNLAYSNLRDGLVDNYLENEAKFVERFPIIQHTSFVGSRK